MPAGESQRKGVVVHLAQRVSAILLSGLLAVVVTGCGGSASSPAVVSPPAASAAPSGPSGPSGPSTEPSTQAPSPAQAFEDFNVEVGGITIHGGCSGTRPAHTPVAVLSHGIGGDYTELDVMTQHLLEKTMVCGYSRGGVGRSQRPLERPRSAADVVAEMRGVLDAAEIEPPYFLVGFSGGGSFVIMFAQAYPGDVVGLVSINPVPPYSRWIERARDVWSPEEFQSIELDWYAGMNEEGIDMTGTDTLLTDSLPDTLPFAVMFAEDCAGDTSFCARLEPPLSETTELLAGVGAGGRFIKVEGAGHNLDLDQPQRVRDTLDEIWAEATD